MVIATDVEKSAYSTFGHYTNLDAVAERVAVLAPERVIGVPDVAEA